MKWFPLILIVTFAGCALVPREQRQQSAVSASETLATENALTIRRALAGERTPSAPPLTISGTSNRVEVTINPSNFRESLEVDSATAGTAGSDRASSVSRSVSIPFGVNMALLGVGILVLLLALRRVRASSAAAAAAFNAGDQFLANRIRALRERMSHVTDANELARGNSEIGELEGARGRLRKGVA